MLNRSHKSRCKKHNFEARHQRKLKAIQGSAFAMMLLALFAGMAFLAAGYLFFSRSGDSFDFLFCAVFGLALFILSVFFLVIFTHCIGK